MVTFREALLRRIDTPGGPSLRAVAAGSGVSYEQLKKLRQRDTATTNVDDAVKIARFFGVTLDEFLGDTMAADRARAVALYMQLSPEERQFLRDAAAGRASRGLEEG